MLHPLCRMEVWFCPRCGGMKRKTAGASVMIRVQAATIALGFAYQHAFAFPYLVSSLTCAVRETDSIAIHK